MLFHITLVVCISILIFSCEKANDHWNKQSQQKLQELLKQRKACHKFLLKPLDVFTREWKEQLKRKPEYNHMLYHCPKLFYETFTIGDHKKFLGPVQFKNYQQSLKNQNCKQAEQILYKKYQATYSRAFKINLLDTYDSNLSDWRFHLLRKQAPETYFCFAKTQFESAQKIIDSNNIETQPITDLRKIFHNKEQTSAERKRNKGLWNIFILMTRDYTPAQLEIIKLSIEGRVFQLREDQHYSLLKRLDYLGKLPPELQTEYESTKEKLAPEIIKSINKRIEKYSFFYVKTMPTKAYKNSNKN